MSLDIDIIIITVVFKSFSVSLCGFMNNFVCVVRALFYLSNKSLSVLLTVALCCAADVELTCLV